MQEKTTRHKFDMRWNVTYNIKRKLFSRTVYVGVVLNKVLIK